MTDPGPASAENLSGVWNGLYSYAHGGSVAFVATLTEIGGSLGGTVHEPCTAGGSPADTMTAQIAGSRSGNTVAFVKTYEGGNPYYAHPVRYAGRLSADATEIAGTWSIPGAAAGTFLMMRAAGRKAKAKRKAEVRA